MRVTCLAAALAVLVVGNVEAAWLEDAQAGIREAEYYVTSQGGVYQAPNRAHGYRTSFSERGMLIRPRLAEEAGAWTWGLTWVAYGRGDRSWPVEAAALSVHANRINYRRGPLAEWYENGPRGLKQSFLLPAPPGGGRLAAGETVHLDLALEGRLAPILATDRQAIDFVDASGARVLRYDTLVVTDARGRTVAAWMEGFAREGVRGVRLLIDAKDARFPLTVDPLATSPVWSVEGNQAQALLGTSVATAGDVNGDGYSDVLVGAPNFDNGEPDEGRAYLFLGSAAGPGATPAWTLELGQAGANLGTSVASAGDVNGDGYADVILGAPGLDFALTDEGAAAVFLGSASGLETSPIWGVPGGQASASFGQLVAGAGDVNGDGYGDILVGAPFYDNGHSEEGRVSLYLGSASGPEIDAAWSAEGNAFTALLGFSAATAGDVNGDGFSDVIVGAFGHGSQAGRALVYHGSAAGLGATHAWSFTGAGTERVGISVGTAGDINGDGYADVIVGADGYANGNAFEGRALVFHGAAAGLAVAPNWQVEGNGENAVLGFSVGTAGDVDGDGYADVIVGAHHHREPLQFSNGRAEVYRGSPNGLATAHHWRVVGASESRLGASVGTAGDVNGDGYADVIVGTPHQGSGAEFREGRASVYLGSPAHLSTTPGWIQDDKSLLPAGDVNGDGYDDVLDEDGAPELHLGGPSGLSTTPISLPNTGGFYRSAGDVNGDGYVDLLRGNPGPFGSANLHLGSPAGPASTASWTVSDGSGLASFGFPVAAAGDINGDGYGDVLVAEPLYNQGMNTASGRVHLYLGSASGPSTTAFVLDAPDPDFHPGGRFGASIAAADVNGDGYGDVVIAAPRKHNEDDTILECGRVYVYAGAPNGTLTLITILGNGFGLDVQLGWLGHSLAAGDVNGDGYADILVGTQPGQGSPRGFVFLGGQSGPSSTPAWSFVGTTSRIEVWSAGDVNGDGYADIVASEPSYSNDLSQEGRAQLFLGSAAGPSLTPVWAVEGNGTNYLLQSTWTMGDVNGDGYADLGGFLFGFNGFQGRAHVYYGNATIGLALRPTQRREDDSAPIARLGSAAENAFRVGLLGRTPFGRGDVRLEAELKPLGTPFNGTETLIGQPTDTGTSGTPLQLLAEGLAQLKGYQWRVRLRYDRVSMPLAPTFSRWITLPWGGWREAELRTGVDPASVAGRASGLIVHKVGLGVTVVWAADSGCVDEDIYAIYEGMLGNFSSHVPIACDTGVFHSWNFTPQAGNRYFLIVPRTASIEGSYGKRKDGSERPPSAAACAPQAVACP